MFVLEVVASFVISAVCFFGLAGFVFVICER